MVTIVTGKVNSGKSTTLLHHYEKHLNGDGFIAIKKMVDHVHYGFNLMRLSSGNTLPWMVHQNYYHNDFAKTMKFGPYYLNLNLLDLVEEATDEMLEQKVSPIYVDEVGVLELNGGGYHNIIRKILKSGTDLVIAVRDDLVPSVLTYFDIKDYELIQAQREEQTHV
jgi:nucleoside-triphosphatase THEP1